MIQDLIKKIETSFELHRETRDDEGIFGTKVSLKDVEVNYINLATDLMDLGYSVMILPELEDMVLTVLKKYD
jgi:hypothetical protein